mgnify:CR=1 FL=1
MSIRSVLGCLLDASRRGVRMLAVGACGIVLAGCATESATTRGEAASDPTRTLAISGALTYRARIALPAGA